MEENTRPEITERDNVPPSELSYLLAHQHWMNSGLFQGADDRFWNAVKVTILYAFGIFLIVFGSIYLNECPAEKMIPTSFLVLGSFLILLRLLSCVHDYRSITSEIKCVQPRFLFWMKAIVGLAGFGLFIALCYWIFHSKVTTKPEDHGLPNYCNGKIYNAAFIGCILVLCYPVGVLCTHLDPLFKFF